MQKAIFSNGTVTWKKSKDSVVLDQKALLQAQPELLQQYPQSRQGADALIFILQQPKSSD
jgi:hypothetical protein